MKGVEEIRKGIIDSDMKEITKILEILDDDSRVLVRGYLSALMDRQQMEKARLAAI